MLGSFSLSPSLRFSKVSTAFLPFSFFTISSSSRITRRPFSSLCRKAHPLPYVHRELPFYPADLLRSSTPTHRTVVCKGGERFSSFISADIPPKEGNSGMETATADNGRDPDLSEERIRLKLEDLSWDHSFVRELPGDPRTDAIPREVVHACYTKVSPSVEVEKPELVVWSESVAELLELDPKEFERPDFPLLFSGATPLVGGLPYAQCYGGHQFGMWAGQLGDGRAITLGELLNSRGERWELQLKGAGKTPYSRFADGLAVLRSSIREFLCSEAMHSLGIPTTRALCLVMTGKDVTRDMFYDGNPKEEPGAIVCRVSQSFLRFGSYQIHASRGKEDLDIVRVLADYTIRNHFPHIESMRKSESLSFKAEGQEGSSTVDLTSNKYAAWSVEVAERTASLIAKWQGVGFTHGVLNTDNMSVLGLTIDYGPFGFLDAFDPSYTPNTTDLPGRRYCFANQPDIGLWNVAQFTTTLSAAELISKEESNYSMERYGTKFMDEYQSIMTKKLGLPKYNKQLISKLLNNMAVDKVDYTNFFRLLSNVKADPSISEDELLVPLKAVLLDIGKERKEAWISWLQTYIQELASSGVMDEQRKAAMDSVNPKFVLRNYLCQSAIDAAEQGDYGEVRSNHINAMRARATESNDVRESNETNPRHGQIIDVLTPATAGGSTKMKRRAKSYMPSRRPQTDSVDKTSIPDDSSTVLSVKNSDELFRSSQLQEENVRIEASFSGWEERVGSAELERAVLSLLEFGQISAAKQLQQKLSPAHVPSEFAVVDAALNLAAAVSSGSSELSVPVLDSDVLSVIQSNNMLSDNQITDPLQVLEAFATKCTEGCGRGLCKRIIAVVKSANVLGLSFSEAFGKRPIELLQLLSLKAQDSFEQAKLLVQTHFMPPSSIARILAESFLKGLLAAHRGGYMDSQKEEGPAPLLWRISDFLKWAELCPSEPEIGHALMRLVITGQEIPHACEVELLILSHHFYKSSACLDGVDVLVSLAAARVESYVSEGDFSCLARLVTGVSNFHALNFILGILIENGQLELLLHKYSAADTTTGAAESVRGFRMAVLTSLKHSNPHDLDAFAMVYNHFDMKHETASLLESRATQSMQSWLFHYDREQNEDLLESMRYFIEAAEVHSTIDAGNKTRRACAQAFLLSLQIRIPDFDWLNLSETNARRALVEQSRFQEALIVAEAYGLNQPSEWALVLWNQMLKPDLTEQFVAEFVSVLPLQPSMLGELARFYRAEVAARGDQSHFSVWLSPGGLPAEWARHLGRSFRSLLKRTRDLRVRMQLASVATGFSDVIDACMKILDRMPDNAVPLVLRKGHGGAYLPLM